MSDKISKAYPNYEEYMSITPPRDTSKWIEAVKAIYYQVHKGSSRGQALENVIAEWDNMEKLDFKNWLKFYEENVHKKYSEASDTPIQIKVGQIGYWEDINRAGYIVPGSKEVESVGNAFDFAKKDHAVEQVETAPIDNKREIIESQRNKIVSRLDSAEKLLRSQEGQVFAGKDFETLMHIIYELKKKIHTVNKISTSTRLYQDMIIREANIQTRNGFSKAAELLFKIAEDVPLSAAVPASPAVGAGFSGSPLSVGLVNTSPPNNPPAVVPAPSGPGMPPVAPIAPGKPPGKAMEGFLNNLSGNKDIAENDDFQVHEDSNGAWVVEAQTAEVPEVTEEAVKPTQDENLEVVEKADNVTPIGSSFDQKAEQLFQNLKIEDVVQKLEDTTKYYKTREMPRQLAWIDMMLDHLGLAPFFPALAEATNKALDSNQYILTRLEDITSRLRGTIQTNDIDLKGQNPIPSSPELEATRNKLQSDQDKDDQRKKMKKEQENAQFSDQSKPEPQLEVEEDLGGPVVNTQIAKPAPAPAPVRAPVPAPIK